MIGPVRIASFFSGIGGLELGLEAALDAETVFQCESDHYALAVLKRHWPGVQRHDDITTLKPEDIPDADVWCGGFPCQDISLAGKGAGIHDGSRSSLWWAWYDLIRVARPRFVVIENVAAFAGRGLGDVLLALAEAGYDAEWDTVGAWEVGAPHRRNRVFIVAQSADTYGQPRGAEPISEPRSGDPTRTRDDGPEGHVAHPEEQSRRSGLRPGGEGWERRRRLGHSGRPGFVPNPNSRRQQGERCGGIFDGERPALGDHADGCGGEGPVAYANGDEQYGRPSTLQVGRGWSPRDDAAKRCVGGRTQWGAEPNVGRVAHGVPARVDRLRCLGNAVVPQCAEVVGRQIAFIINEPSRKESP